MLLQTTKQVSSSGIASELHSGGVQLDYRKWNPAIRTEIFHGFPQALQTNAGIEPPIKPRQIFSTSFPIH